MKDRSWECIFDFGDEDSDRLILTLGTPAKETRRFLKCIRHSILSYIGFKSLLSSDPKVGPAKVIKNFATMERCCLELRNHLEDLDPIGNWSPLSNHLGKSIAVDLDLQDISHLEDEEWFEASLEQEMMLDGLAEDLVVRLSKDLLVLSNAIKSAIDYSPTPKRGSPPKLNEFLLIQSIAAEYKKQFGKLPSSSGEGNFHAFLIEVFQILGTDQRDCSRVLEKAIDSFID